jgi:hypothetical protein
MNGTNWSVKKQWISTNFFMGKATDGMNSELTPSVAITICADW